MAPDNTRPGVTYICQETTSRKTAVIVVCHYDDKDLWKHISDNDSAFNYYGYVQDAAYPTPNDIRGMLCQTKVSDTQDGPRIEGRYYVFVRFMINPEAAGLWDKTADAPSGIGFPVGWAVRGYMPEELVRINKDRDTSAQLKNELNMLPVYRSDRQTLKCVATAGADLCRWYYILDDPSAQLLSPKSLKDQVNEAQKAALSSQAGLPPVDITSARRMPWTRNSDAEAEASVKGASIAEYEAARTAAMAEAIKTAIAAGFAAQKTP